MSRPDSHRSAFGGGEASRQSGIRHGNRALHSGSRRVAKSEGRLWAGLLPAVLASVLCLAPRVATSAGAFHALKPAPGLSEVMSHLNETAKHLRTLSADLEYTKVTVVVDDKSTERGEIFYAKRQPPQLLINFKEPDPKVILMKKNEAEIYFPKINEVQEYDLEKHAELVQQFLLLGFGTDSADLEAAYIVKLTGEENVGGDTTSVLELTPRQANVAAQLSKVQLWISEKSWLPVQQKFVEPSGDYLLTRYTQVQMNPPLSASTFEIRAAKGARHVRMR